MTTGPDPSGPADPSDRPRFCGSCGAELRAGAHFCGSCGMAAPPPAGTSPKGAVPPPVGPPLAPASSPKQQAVVPPPPGSPPPPVPAPASPSSSSSSGTRIALAAVVVIAIVVVIGAVLFAQGSDGDGDTGTDTAATAPDGDGSSSDESTAATSSDLEPTDATTATTAEVEPVSTPLQPRAAVASSERRSVNLLCTDEPVAYTAPQLVDGNPQTGWGASAGDGTGASIRIEFSGQRHLTSVGLTPGYLRVGPRQDQGCNDVSAFTFNRFVPSVEYRFDDGTTEVQSFSQTPELQTMPVDVVTSSVTITILETVKWGTDDDTILSEAEFTGYIE